MLSGCATTLRPAIVTSGALPARGGSFALVEGVAGPSAAALVTCLEARGYTVSATPLYIAMITDTERPASVGVASMAAGDGKPGPWLADAAPRNAPTRSLSLVLVRAATGEEVYRISVNAVVPAKPGRRPPINLADAVCAGLSPPSR